MEQTLSKTTMEKELALTIIAVVTIGIVFGTSIINNIHGQNDTQVGIPVNTTTSREQLKYIVVFEDRIISIVDNETDTVTAKVGTNLEKIREVFVEELSLGNVTPDELKEQVKSVIDSRVSGESCNIVLTTKAGNKTECLNSNSTIIWLVHPSSIGVSNPSDSASSQTETRNECYDSGYNDGRSETFSEETFDQCEENNGEYHNGFVDGCKSEKGDGSLWYYWCISPLYLFPD